VEFIATRIKNREGSSDRVYVSSTSEASGDTECRNQHVLRRRAHTNDRIGKVEVAIFRCDGVSHRALEDLSKGWAELREIEDYRQLGSALRCAFERQLLAGEQLHSQETKTRADNQVQT
jgi:hypothetical protein